MAIVPPGATTIYVGGQNAVDAAGALVGAGDVAAQSVRALENVATALAAAGASLRDVVQWTVLFVDGVDVAAGYAAIAADLACDEPGLVTAAQVAGLACAVRLSRSARSLPSFGSQSRAHECLAADSPRWWIRQLPHPVWVIRSGH